MEWFETNRCFIDIAFQLSLENILRRVQVNQDALEHFNFWFMLMMLIYWPEAYICRSFSIASKKIGLEVNADETKHMVISRDYNAVRSHNIKIDNSSFEMVEQFKYM